MKKAGVVRGLKFKSGFGSGGLQGKQWLCTKEALGSIFRKIRRAE